MLLNIRAKLRAALTWALAITAAGCGNSAYITYSSDAPHARISYWNASNTKTEANLPYRLTYFMDPNFTLGKCTYVNAPTVHWADGYSSNTKFIKLCDSGNREYSYIFQKNGASRDSDNQTVYKNLQSAVVKCTNLGLQKATPQLLECVLKYSK